LRRAVGLWAKVAQLDTSIHSAYDSRFELARALALLAGLGTDPKSGVTAAEAATFADRAVTALRDAIKAGWAQLDELKEADFDSLCSRADFQKLVGELEAHNQAAAAKDNDAGTK
jgi:hypothetical protein